MPHSPENGVTNMEDVERYIKEERESQEIPTSLRPSFNGRLNIANFAYLPALVKDEQTSHPLRRSPRADTIVATKASARSPSTKRQLSKPTRTSTSPSKRVRSPAGYAPPSKYAHLPALPDRIEHDLLVLFVGLNPGVRTAQDGHAYAHPSNLFWKLLHSSGLTTRRCHPSEDVQLPRLFSLGNTNIVSRATRNGSELSKQDMDDAVDVLEAKIRLYKPESVCIVGKSIWESIWRVRHGRPIKKEEFRYGWQDEGDRMGNVDEEWKGARVFVATSTSGLAASLSPAEKERIWRELGSWVEMRRLERAAEEQRDNEI